MESATTTTPADRLARLVCKCHGCRPAVPANNASDACVNAMHTDIAAAEDMLDPRSDEFTHPDGNEDAAPTDRYILCHVKVNGVENGRTEILDTTIDGGEGEPLIVASFFDRHEAIKFCKAANAVPKMLAALKHAHRIEGIRDAMGECRARINSAGRTTAAESATLARKQLAEYVVELRSIRAQILDAIKVGGGQ